MPKQTVRDLDVAGRKVLVRVDFNVPQTADGGVADDRRIRSALPTLNDDPRPRRQPDPGQPPGPAHRRPGGRRAVPAGHAWPPGSQELIGRPVMKVDDTVGPEAQAACAALEPGGIVVLENVRFNKGEKKGDPEFARQLAALADCYVNDAFGTCHRDEASMVAVPEQFPPDRRAIGFLVEKELQILDTLLGHPQHPYVAVMGGAKVSDKIIVIENLIKKVDRLLIGGAMTYTFLKAQGNAVGKSKVEADKLDVARQAARAGRREARPAQRPPGRHPSPRPAPRPRSSAASEIPDGWFGMDIGPATIAEYRAIIKQAGTVVWNGPMGKFEVEAFAPGNPGDRRGPGRLAGRDGRRRRRVGRGRREVRPGRPGQPRLDRRRRVSRSRSRESRSTR